MKVTIFSKKTSTGLKKLTESKKTVVKKKLLREFTGLELGLAAILSFVLGRIFPMLKSLFTGMGDTLEKASKDTEAAIQKDPNLDPETKQDVLQEFKAAKDDLYATLKQLEENSSKSAQDEQRPSAIIAGKVAVLVQVVTKTKDENELAEETIKVLDKAIAELSTLKERLGALDFTSAISSKKDPKGLWNAIPEASKGQFKKDEDWLKFTQAYAVTVPEANRKQFKTAPMPAGA